MNDFNNTYNKYKNYLLKIIKRYIYDADIAEDILQESFIRIWKYDQTFKGECQYKTWITTIAINSAITYLQSGIYRNSQLECDFDAFGSGVGTTHIDYQSPELIISNEQDFEFAAAKLKKLSRVMYDTVNLYVLEGYCYADVATKLNTNTGTVRSRLNRARWLISP